MSLVSRDYIQRLLQSIAAAISRALGRRQAGDLPGARRELDVATSELLGPVGRLAPYVDARTAADLLGDAHRTAAWARLVAADAELLDLMGRAGEAEAARKRAVELVLEAWMREKTLGDEATETLAQLRVAVARDGLDQRYQDALGAIDVAGTPQRPAA
jgi:hypothetical protein